MYRFLFFMPVLLVGILLMTRSIKFPQCEEYDSLVVNSSVFDLIDPLHIDVEDSEECKYSDLTECFSDDLKVSKFKIFLKAQPSFFKSKFNSIIFYSDVSPPLKQKVAIISDSLESHGVIL